MHASKRLPSASAHAATGVHVNPRSPFLGPPLTPVLDLLSFNSRPLYGRVLLPGLLSDPCRSLTGERCLCLEVTAASCDAYVGVFRGLLLSCSTSSWTSLSSLVWAILQLVRRATARGTTSASRLCCVSVVVTTGRCADGCKAGVLDLLGQFQLLYQLILCNTLL